jgi:hypothetical protein
MPPSDRELKVEEALPFQVHASEEPGEHEAPKNAEAVALPVVHMATTVGTGPGVWAAHAP